MTTEMFTTQATQKPVQSSMTTSLCSQRNQQLERGTSQLSETGNSSLIKNDNLLHSDIFMKYSKAKKKKEYFMI